MFNLFYKSAQIAVHWAVVYQISVYNTVERVQFTGAKLRSEILLSFFDMKSYRCQRFMITIHLNKIRNKIECSYEDRWSWTGSHISFHSLKLSSLGRAWEWMNLLTCALQRQYHFTRESAADWFSFVILRAEICISTPSIIQRPSSRNYTSREMIRLASSYQTQTVPTRTNKPPLNRHTSGFSLTY